MTNYSELIKQMTLEEKASLMSGENFWNTKSIDRLGIPSIMMTDGPHGLRKQGGKADHLGLNKSIPATCFPTAATLANSWDRELLREVGTHLGKEAHSEKVSVLLGPGLNIKRNPLCGRNFEYFSEDPYLSGKLAASMIQGIEAEGVAACPKHYAVNSQEHLRMTIDEVVDERALREIYLEGFRYAIQEGKAKTIMTSYNRVNGEYANENHHLLQDILYGEWSFDGVAITDWGGNNDRVEGLKAGNQLEMPSTGGITDKEIVAAVQAGTLDETILDQAVANILNLVFTTKKDDTASQPVNYDVHHQKAAAAARESIVLLKNEENILPLSKSQHIAVIGPFATVPRYQGAGSSLINPTKIENSLNELEKMSDLKVTYAQGFERFGQKNMKLKQEALQAISGTDTVLLYLGLDESSEAEGIDRQTMALPQNQLDLVNALSKEHTRVVVVLSGGAVVELPFADNVQGIIHGYLGGQASASAMIDVLFGDANPSGKLAESYPFHYKDVSSAPYYPGTEVSAEHRESIYVGYRYFDTQRIPVRFPFGYGLSYTSFEYQDVTVNNRSIIFTIQNVGERAGAEVAQLYVKPLESSVFRANKELKGFEKVYLEPGQAKRVKMDLDDHAFAYFNVQLKRWVTETGQYEIQIGASIDDIRLSSTIRIVGEEVVNPYAESDLSVYEAGNVHEVSDAEFHRLLGYTPQHPKWDHTKDLGFNDTVAQARYKNVFGKALFFVVNSARKILFRFNKPLQANNVMFIMNMPFRQISRFTKGKVSDSTVRKLIKLINR